MRIKKMKTLKFIVLTIGIVLTTLTFQSCSDDGYSLGKFWVEIATVESGSGSAHYFRLDDGSTLWPAAPVGGYTGHNLEDGQRIILNYTILSDSFEGFDHYIKVNDISTLLTKKIAEDKEEENDEFYGTDPVKIGNIWTGNNYLNIYFGANYGGYKKHFVNLVQTNKEEDPYYFEFRHNAYDDPANYGSESLVCFKLSDIDTGGETVTLTIAVKTFDGDKTYTVEYNSNNPNKTLQGIYPETSMDSIENLY